jgi:adenine-specific DNA methylase
MMCMKYFTGVHAMDLKKEYDERLIKAVDEYFLLTSMHSPMEYIAKTYGVYPADLVTKIAKMKKARNKEAKE